MLRILILAHNVNAVPECVKLVATNPGLETTFDLSTGCCAWTRRHG